MELMFPVRDSVLPRRTPVVMPVILAVNVAIYLYQVVMPATVESRFIVEHGLVPARFFAGVAESDPRAVVPAFTSMFLHGGLFHVAGNMWFLWIFGDNVEDRLGRLNFATFYLLTGLAAAAGQLLAEPGSTIPMVGASGAIAGVLGAYLRLYPKARVETAVPIFVFIQIIELPAFVFLLLWFALQFLGLGSPGVAWWAHILGFVAGFALSFLAPGRSAPPPRPPARYARYRRRG